MRRASSICWRCRAYPRPAARERHRCASAAIEVDFQIPLFDFGEVRVRDAEQTYLAAVNRLTDKAIVVRSEARDAYRVYRASYDIAAHYQREILPLRKIISDETLLRYNAMQIDVFALLAEARQRIAATTAAIEAQRDFWLANTNLVAAVAGTGSGRRPRRSDENRVCHDRRSARSLIFVTEIDHVFSQRLSRIGDRARRRRRGERARSGRGHSRGADAVRRPPCSRRSCRRAGRTISRW